MSHKKRKYEVQNDFDTVVDTIKYLETKPILYSSIRASIFINNSEYRLPNDVLEEKNPFVVIGYIVNKLEKIINSFFKEYDIYLDDIKVKDFETNGILSSYKLNSPFIEESSVSEEYSRDFPNLSVFLNSVFDLIERYLNKFSYMQGLHVEVDNNDMFINFIVYSEKQKNKFMKYLVIKDEQEIIKAIEEMEF